jgi:hypothetical protein
MDVLTRRRRSRGARAVEPDGTNRQKGRNSTEQSDHQLSLAQSGFFNDSENWGQATRAAILDPGPVTLKITARISAEIRYCQPTPQLRVSPRPFLHPHRRLFTRHPGMGKLCDVSMEQTGARPKSAPNLDNTCGEVLDGAAVRIILRSAGRRRAPAPTLATGKPISHRELLAAVKDRLAHRCSPPQIGVLRGEFVSLAADHPTASAQTDPSEQAAPTRSELAPLMASDTGGGHPGLKRSARRSTKHPAVPTSPPHSSS